MRFSLSEQYARVRWVCEMIIRNQRVRERNRERPRAIEERTRKNWLREGKGDREE